MRYEDIALGVKAGTITLDECGHRINCTPKEFVEDYEDTLAGANGKHDGNWDKDKKNPEKNWDKEMREFYQFDLDRDCQEGETIFSRLGERNYCFQCGERLSWVFDGNVLTLRGYFDGKNFTQHPRESRCPHETIKPFTGTIQVNSLLVLTNFFRTEDAPEGKKYGDEYSLNSSRGRENVAKYKLAQNIAYGQMSNMSIGVYLHPSNKSIILGHPYIGEQITQDWSEEKVDNLTPEEWKALEQIEGHALVETICLDVWRYEVSDTKTVGATAVRELKQEGRDVIVLKVPHGTWNFTHYYELFREDKPTENEHIYARLTLAE